MHILVTIGLKTTINKWSVLQIMYSYTMTEMLVCLEDSIFQRGLCQCFPHSPPDNRDHSRRNKRKQRAECSSGGGARSML